MELEIEIVPNPYTYRVDHYPWPRLEAQGDIVVLCGASLNKESARQMAYTYAKRHGFKVSVIKIDPRRLKIVRIS